MEGLAKLQQTNLGFNYKARICFHQFSFFLVEHLIMSAFIIVIIIIIITWWQGLCGQTSCLRDRPGLTRSASISQSEDEDDDDDDDGNNDDDDDVDGDYVDSDGDLLDM